MAYCYECGEKVAEIDVFCPFCGISLKPVAVEGSDDVSMDKTVVIQGGDSIEIPDAVKFMRPDTPQSDATSSPLLEISESLPEINQPTGEFLSSKTEENIYMKTDSVEIPAEMIPDETVSQPVFSDGEDNVETSVSSDNSELPEPTHIEILKPIEEETELVVSPVNEEKPVEEIISSENNVQEIVNFNDKDEKIETIESPNIEIQKPIEENLDEFTPVDNSSDYKFDPDADFEFVEEKPAIAEENQDISQAETLQTVENLAIIPNIDANFSFETNVNSGTFEEQKTDQSQDNVATQIHPSQKLEKILEEIDINQFDKPQTQDFVESAALVETEISESGSVNEVQNLEAQTTETADENQSTIENQTGIEAISKPIEELEISDALKSESVFDSVQIVQTEQKADDFEQKVAEAESANISGDVKMESRSYTTPIVVAENTDGKKPAKLKPLDEGTVLNNRYEIVRKIGGGGMGAVYLASDKNLGGVLRAVKEMVQSYIEEIQQDKAIADFKRESMLLTSLEHVAIPTIYDYFFDEKEARFYLVMKYISGGDLSGRLRASAEGKIDEKTVTEWGIQIADVLHYLHSHEPSIVYRDLKPANVMVDGNSGRLMLIDFGIARWINKEEKGVTAVGTMGYAPPELFSGNVEARSDIYSLGSTMFHLLTGADPQSNPLLIFDFQKNPRPRQINSALSDQMEKILMQTVEYTADKRFASAAELKRVLEEHLENLKAGRVTYGSSETEVAVLPNSYVFCGFCGQRIVASDVFCAFCGSQQPMPGQQKPALFGGVSVQTAKLTLLSTEEISAPIFSLDKESNIIGRRDPMSNIFPEVDLSKFDPQTKISRRHARVWREGNNYMVEDLGSSNGTILLSALSDNVRLLPHQPHVLTNGDKIKIGDTTMSFLVG